MIRVSSFGETKNVLREEYVRRLQRLIPFEWKEILLKRCPDRRSTELLPEEKKFLELNTEFYLIDQTGKELDSDHFAEWLFKVPTRHLIVGPAIGFHKDFFKKSSGQFSLSKLTLTHGLAQAVLAESLYRAACIQKNHPFVK